MFLGTSEFLRSCLLCQQLLGSRVKGSVSDFTGLYKHKHSSQHQPLKFSTEALCVVAQASDTSTEETGSL